MKKIYLVLIMVFFGGQIMAQSSTSTIREGQTNRTNSSASIVSISTTQANNEQLELPGFPVYINTGNKELDEANLAIAQESWIKENKEIYDAYVSKISEATREVSVDQRSNLPTHDGKIIKVSKTELEMMSEIRRNYVMAHPELYTIEE